MGNRMSIIKDKSNFLRTIFVLLSQITENPVNNCDFLKVRQFSYGRPL
jgi:hypothetical protein